MDYKLSLIMARIDTLEERREVLTKRFLPRDAMRKRGLCCRPVSVRPSLHPSRWYIVSRRLMISSNFFLGPVAHHSICMTPRADTQF